MKTQHCRYMLQMKWMPRIAPRYSTFVETLCRNTKQGRCSGRETGTRPGRNIKNATVTPEKKVWHAAWPALLGKRPVQGQAGRRTGVLLLGQDHERVCGRREYLSGRLRGTVGLKRLPSAHAKKREDEAKRLAQRYLHALPDLHPPNNRSARSAVQSASPAKNDTVYRIQDESDTGQDRVWQKVQGDTPAFGRSGPELIQESGRATRRRADRRRR